MFKDMSTVSNLICSRLLISQDRDEIYITLADYGPSYKKYVVDPDFDVSNPSADDFCTMRCFGPFRTGFTEEMSEVSQFILAYTMTHDCRA